MNWEVTEHNQKKRKEINKAILSVSKLKKEAKQRKRQVESIRKSVICRI